jgi:hypothetical protein
VIPVVIAWRELRAHCLRALPFAAILAVTANSSFAQAPAGPLAPAAPADPSEVMPAPPPRRPPPARNPIGGHPNIAGLWVINRDDSDDARRKLREAEGYPSTNTRRNGPFGGNGPYGNGPYGNGPYGGPNGPGGNGPYGGNPNAPNGNRGGMNNDNQGEDPSTELTKLTISETTSSAKVLGASDQVLGQYTAPQTDTSSGPPVYPPVSSTSSSSGSPGSSGSSNSNSNSKNAPQLTASWQNDAFVIVQQDTTGAKWKTTRRFELSSDKSQLQVTNTIEGPKLKKTATFVLVYDLANIQPDQ